MARRYRIQADNDTERIRNQLCLAILESEDSPEESPDRFVKGPIWTLSPFFKAIGLRNIALIRKQLESKL